MSEIGRLTEVDPRAAWAHEAHNFTPWLAEHLDVLAEAVGTELEIEGTEVAVEAFSADILARNPQDGSKVLIENQLETTNHTHLGQVLTYLAGLEAQVIIWVATSFREPHLSAIKWLNEHTIDPFAFFAVRLRVVRIGDSLPAPIFEVLERPNNWERRVHARTRDAGGMSEAGRAYQEYWRAYLARYPDDSALGFTAAGTSTIWLKVDAAVPLVVSVFKSKDGVGLFVRGRFGADHSDVIEFLAPYAEQLSEQLDAPFGPTQRYMLLHRNFKLDPTEPPNWDLAHDWVHEIAPMYVQVLQATLAEAA